MSAPIKDVGIQADSLNLLALLSHLTGHTVPAAISVIIGAITAIGTFFFFQRRQTPQNFLAASMITTFAMFLFGGQAYANYYYFVGGLILLSRHLSKRFAIH